MKVTHRLYFAFLPSAVGVMTVAALSYWGQHARSVPELFLVVAVAATMGTLFMSWRNVRYVARRVERLSSWREGTGHGSSNSRLRGAVAGAFDELDTIEGVVTNLADVVESANSQRDDEARASQQRIGRFASLLSEVSTAAARRIDEIRLPLHILLENRFGDLNENQEEMLEAARSAAETANRELVMLGEVAELELGRRVARRDRIFLADMWNAIMPMLEADAKTAEVMLLADIPPLLPPILGDATQLQQAFLLMVREVIASTSAGQELRLTLIRHPGELQVSLTGGVHGRDSLRAILAQRLIDANRGDVRRLPESLTVAFKT